MRVRCRSGTNPRSPRHLDNNKGRRNSASVSQTGKLPKGHYQLPKTRPRYWFTGLLVYGEVRVDDDPEPGRKGRLSCSAVVPPVRGSEILSRVSLKGTP